MKRKLAWHLDQDQELLRERIVSKTLLLRLQHRQTSENHSRHLSYRLMPRKLSNRNWLMSFLHSHQSNRDSSEVTLESQQLSGMFFDRVCPEIRIPTNLDLQFSSLVSVTDQNLSEMYQQLLFPIHQIHQIQIEHLRQLQPIEFTQKASFFQRLSLIPFHLKKKKHYSKISI